VANPERDPAVSGMCVQEGVQFFFPEMGDPRGETGKEGVATYRRGGVLQEAIDLLLCDRGGAQGCHRGVIVVFWL